MAFFSGKLGKVEVDGAVLDIRSWDLTIAEEFLTTTNTGSACFQEGIGGIKSASGSVDADWDGAAAPTDSPPGLVEGATPTLKLFIEDIGRFFEIPSFIENVNVTSEVEGKLSYSFNFQSVGPFIKPA